MSANTTPRPSATPDPSSNCADDVWKSLLHRMFDESPVGISPTTVEGGVSRANRAVSAMLGYTQAELAGKDFEHITHPDSGSGIGLAICDKIASRHGGRIWVDAAPERGSVFSVALPSQPRDEV